MKNAECRMKNVKCKMRTAPINSEFAVSRSDPPKTSRKQEEGAFNAKTQRRQGAKTDKTLCAFAPLRLCVKNSASSTFPEDSRTGPKGLGSATVPVASVGDSPAETSCIGERARPRVRCSAPSPNTPSRTAEFCTTDFTDFTDTELSGSRGVHPCHPCHYKKKSRISDKISGPPICRRNQAVRAMSVRGMEEGVLQMIPLTIIPLPSPMPFFNAKTQRRQGAKTDKTLCAFAPLRLCVKNSASSTFLADSRSAGFQTCRVADFQIGSTAFAVRAAGWEARATADLEVCATGSDGVGGQFRPPKTE